MRLLIALSILSVLLLVVSAKKQLEENVDPIEPETKEHSSKKYSKDFQKSHHHGHKHKKNIAQKEQPNEELKSKSAPVDIPESEVHLQENVETSKKAVEERKRKEQTEDLHLQDLTYEENLKKDKKKKGHHGAHHAEVVGKEEKKLFEQDSKNPDEKVIEDSFEPLKNAGKKNKGGKDKKSKDKSKTKKAFEKTKDKNSKKSKDGKNKNKDKKHKNKDKKKF